MKNTPVFVFVSTSVARLACVVGFVSLFFGVAGAKEKWEAIPAEELASTECKSYPGSSAEVLLERRVLDFTGADQVIHYFRRIKIYSPKGASDEGVFAIEYFADQQVGSDILELKWTETAWSSVWWYFQNQLPVRDFTFSLEGSIANCVLVAFNQPKTETKRAKSDPTTLEIKNIPPFLEEAYMPPARDVRGWFLLLYVESLADAEDRDHVWKEKSAAWEHDFRRLTKPNAALREKVAELLNGAATDDEKLRRLYDFCQQTVTNFHFFESAELQTAKKKYEQKSDPQTPSQTLKLKNGFSQQINELFAALVRAAGFEVRLARSASRNETLVVRHQNGWLFVPDDLVAVKSGGSWRYFAPGDYFVPAGMLDASNEFTPCLLTDPDKVIFEVTPGSKADLSPVHRKGRFVLDAEGNLEGEVEITLGGHRGIVDKKNWRGEQQDEIDTEYRATVTKRLPGGEVGDLRWENLKGNKLPLIIRYKLKVPAYADLAGAKIIFPANVFTHGAAAIFESASRKYPIFFSYAWSEHDDIEIVWPEGFTLDAGSAPSDIGDPAGILGAHYDVSFKPKSRTIVYRRDFALGGNGSIEFEAGSYLPLKKMFDAIQHSDEHTLVLKAVPTTAAAAPADKPAL